MRVIIGLMFSLMALTSALFVVFMPVIYRYIYEFAPIWVTMDHGGALGLTCFLAAVFLMFVFAVCCSGAHFAICECGCSKDIKEESGDNKPSENK